MLKEEINFDEIANDILLCLQENRLEPTSFGLVFSVPNEDFIGLQADPKFISNSLTILVNGKTEGNTNWNIQINRESNDNN